MEYPHMTKQRYNELMKNPELKLTPEEYKNGWHFCYEWDELLIHISWKEFKSCTCKGYKNNYLKPIPDMYSNDILYKNLMDAKRKVHSWTCTIEAEGEGINYFKEDCMKILIDLFFDRKSFYDWLKQFPNE